MGTNTYFISDTHFGHVGIITFLDANGNRIRPFNTIEEHDETLVNNWNARVRPDDLIYHLGDVVMNRRCLPILSRLNGRKRLIKGNHDLFDLKEYTPYFENIYGVCVLKDMVLSHIPLHPNCLEHRFGVNIHGHLHSESLNDKKYYSVCVEKTNFMPISIEELRYNITLDNGINTTKQ